jgi:hypothetical protein
LQVSSSHSTTPKLNTSACKRGQVQQQQRMWGLVKFVWVAGQQLPQHNAEAEHVSLQVQPGAAAATGESAMRGFICK